MAQRISLSGRGESIKIGDDGQIVVEWYDFGDDVPYESANMLLFDEKSWRQLAGAIGCADGIDALALAEAVAERFGSYFAIRDYVDSAGLPYEREVDFNP